MYYDGSLDEAEAAARECLLIIRLVGGSWVTINVVVDLSLIALRRRDLERAGRLLGCASRYADDHNLALDTHLYWKIPRKYPDSWVEDRNDPEFVRAFEEGKAISFEEGIAFALGETEWPPVEGPLLLEV